jgi:hypothetical protein
MASRKNSSGNRLDVGWQHEIDIDKNSRKVQCKYCQKIISGGIFRFKQHLACTRKDVEPCQQVPENVKQMILGVLVKNLEATEKKRKALQYSVNEDDDDEIKEISSKDKGKRVASGSGSTQTTLNQLLKKDIREEACRQIARFFYTSAIPFNCVKNPEFIKALEMVAKHGPGFKPPSYYDIREKYLKQEVDQTMKLLEEYKLEWKKTGCSIMSDGWTDKKRRCICNFLVNSPKGTVFLSSVDTSNMSKTADKVFEMLDAIVERIGKENVVQVVTDNAANYKAAGQLLMEKRKSLFWTPCAAHCIDLN